MQKRFPSQECTMGGELWVVVFDESIMYSATLHVPAASIYAYKTTHPWDQFKTIVAI